MKLRTTSQITAYLDTCFASLNLQDLSEGTDWPKVHKEVTEIARRLKKGHWAGQEWRLATEIRIDHLLRRMEKLQLTTEAENITSIYYASRGKENGPLMPKASEEYMQQAIRDNSDYLKNIYYSSCGRGKSLASEALKDKVVVPPEKVKGIVESLKEAGCGATLDIGVCMDKESKFLGNFRIEAKEKAWDVINIKSSETPKVVNHSPAPYTYSVKSWCPSSVTAYLAKVEGWFMEKRYLNKYQREVIVQSLQDCLENKKLMPVTIRKIKRLQKWL